MWRSEKGQHATGRGESGLLRKAERQHVKDSEGTERKEKRIVRILEVGRGSTCRKQAENQKTTKNGESEP